MRLTIPLSLVATLLLVVGAVAIHKSSVSAGRREFASQLSSTYVDLRFDNDSLSTAITELHRELARKNPYFKDCEFQMDVPNPEGLRLTLSLPNTSGAECLKYILELSLTSRQVQPKKLFITHIHDFRDRRDVVERATDSTLAWFRNVWDWSKYKLGLEPDVPPADPFAPIVSPPKNPFTP